MDQKRITLDKVKICKFASEETLCFQARVLFDGAYIADANNDGHGGCTFINARYRTDGRPAENVAQLEAAEAFAKSLPDVVTKFDDPHIPGKKFSYPMDLEHVVDELVCDFDFEKTVRAGFKRNMKSKVMYVRDGALWEIKGVKDRAQQTAYSIKLHTKYGTAVQVLNTMPEELAYPIYKSLAVAK